jgi:hypothetical protein
MAGNALRLVISVSASADSAVWGSGSSRRAFLNAVISMTSGQRIKAAQPVRRISARHYDPDLADLLNVGRSTLCRSLAR